MGLLERGGAGGLITMVIRQADKKISGCLTNGRSFSQKITGLKFANLGGWKGKIDLSPWRFQAIWPDQSREHHALPEVGIRARPVLGKT